MKWFLMIAAALAAVLLSGGGSGLRRRRMKQAASRTVKRAAGAVGRTVRRNSAGQIIDGSGRPYNVKNAPNWVRKLWQRKAVKARKKG